MLALRRAARRRGQLERQLLAEGVRVAGVDEVGRGCIAGPVYAASAVLDLARVAKLKTRVRHLIRDSKRLSAAQRADILPVIHEVALDCRIGIGSVEEIEQLGIVQATFLAMRRALESCAAPFDLLLVDGKLKVKGYGGAQRTLVKGDDLCFSIAAASIVAKEARDGFMRSQSDLFPHYGFDAHVGYATEQHLDSIVRHGICPLHRKTFDPIRSLLADPKAPLVPVPPPRRRGRDASL